MFRKEFYDKLYEQEVVAERNAKDRNAEVLRELNNITNKLKGYNTDKGIKSEVQLDLAKSEFMSQVQGYMTDMKFHKKKQNIIKLKRAEIEIDEINKKRVLQSKEWEEEQELKESINDKARVLALTKQAARKENLERAAHRQLYLDEERTTENTIVSASDPAIRVYAELSQKKLQELSDNRKSAYIKQVNEIFKDSKVITGLEENNEKILSKVNASTTRIPPATGRRFQPQKKLILDDHQYYDGTNSENENSPVQAQRSSQHVRAKSLAELESIRISRSNELKDDEVVQLSDTKHSKVPVANRYQFDNGGDTPLTPFTTNQIVSPVTPPSKKLVRTETPTSLALTHIKKQKFPVESPKKQVLPMSPETSDNDEDELSENMIIKQSVSTIPFRQPEPPVLKQDPIVKKKIEKTKPAEIVIAQKETQKEVRMEQPIEVKEPKKQEVVTTAPTEDTAIVKDALISTTPTDPAPKKSGLFKGLLNRLTRGSSTDKLPEISTKDYVEESSDSDSLYNNAKENKQLTGLIQKIPAGTINDAFKNLSAVIEKEIGAVNEEKRKTTIKFRMQQMEGSQDSGAFPYETKTHFKPDQRVQVVKHYSTNTTSSDSIELKCVALLDMIKFYPKDLISFEFKKDYLPDCSANDKVDMDEIISDYFSKEPEVGSK
jgi:hypothetical protein